MIVELTRHDLSEIIEFERSTFEAGIQADQSLYERRFDLGHIMLGYRAERLLAVISFSYGLFDRSRPESLPDNFHAWSTQPVPAAWDTQFIYNLGLARDVRGTAVLRSLVCAALGRGADDGCRQVVAEGPLPSFAGNGKVKPNPAVRDCLMSIAQGMHADTEVLFSDPHLALYRKLRHCTIVRVIPDFLPADAASGGFRAMLLVTPIQPDSRDSVRDQQLAAAGRGSL